MKLAGPQRSIRFEVLPDPPDTVMVRAVVCGHFPPEIAPAARLLADLNATLIEPSVRAHWEAEQRRYIHEMLYGRPGAPEPRGILYGHSPLKNARP